MKYKFKDFPKLYTVGSQHPDPCPDCGGKLILDKKRGYLHFECENPICSGNAGATQFGEPLGFPIDRAGRRKRFYLHGLIDGYWKNVTARERGVIRKMIYEYMSLKMGVEQFHVSTCDHAMLDVAIEIARSSLPKYMGYFGCRKDEADVENLQYNEAEAVR